jgi:hypothetical protein
MERYEPFYSVVKRQQNVDMKSTFHNSATRHVDRAIASQKGKTFCCVNRDANSNEATFCSGLAAIKILNVR